MPVSLPARRGRDDAPTYLYARDYQTQADGWRRGSSTTILRSLWGGNVSLPRQLYLRAEEVKPSQRLEYNEDLDLGVRLLEVGAGAVFDEDALASHHHSRGLAGYMRECEARGGAIADLEDRWGERPAQLAPLVVIPPTYNRVLARVQRSVAARDAGGLAQGLSVADLPHAGILRLWKLQDGVARMLRRALAMRGYRLSRATRPRGGAPAGPAWRVVCAGIPRRSARLSGVLPAKLTGTVAVTAGGGSVVIADDGSCGGRPYTS